MEFQATIKPIERGYCTEYFNGCETPATYSVTVPYRDTLDTLTYHACVSHVGSAFHLVGQPYSAYNAV